MSTHRAIRARQPARPFRPCQVDAVELSMPLSALEARTDPDGAPYCRSRIMVRLHGQPLGVVELALDGGADATDVARAIDARLRHDVVAHLAEDGLDGPETVTADGIEATTRPLCLGRPLDPTTTPLASVVVCAHTPCCEQFAVTLASLVANDYPNFEILVVDNNPGHPEVRNLVESTYRSNRRVRYIREWRQGLSRARNAGYQFSRGEIVAFTDDDVVVDRSWITALVSAFADDLEVSCVTGLVAAARLDTESEFHMEETGGIGKGFRGRLFDLEDHRPRSPLFPLAAGMIGAGANFAVRKSALDDLWEFDPALGTGTIAAGGEDLDCFAQLIFAGHRIRYEPRAVLWHTHVGDELELRSKMHAYGIGFSAYLTKQFVRGGGRRLTMVRAVPAAVTYALREGSRHDPRKHDPVSRLVLLAELRGMARGPWAYVRSRVHNAWLTS